VHATHLPSEAHEWGERASAFQADARSEGTDRQRHPGPGENMGHAYPARVYRVEPTGPVEKDRAYADTEPNSWRSAHPMRVAEEVHPRECYHEDHPGEMHWPDHPHYQALGGDEEDEPAESKPPEIAHPRTDEGIRQHLSDQHGLDEADHGDDPWHTHFEDHHGFGDYEADHTHETTRLRAQAAVEPRKAEPKVPSFTWRYSTYGQGPEGGYVDKEETVRGPFYHGSRSKRIKPGDQLTKGRKTNNWGDEGERSQYIHFTTSLDGARDYARKAGGHVYEVHPTGEVQGGYDGFEWKSKHPLHVIRRVDDAPPKTAAALPARTPEGRQDLTEGLEDLPGYFRTCEASLIAVGDRTLDMPVDERIPDLFYSMASTCHTAAEEAEDFLSHFRSAQKLRGDPRRLGAQLGHFRSDHRIRHHAVRPPSPAAARGAPGHHGAPRHRTARGRRPDRLGVAGRAAGLHRGRLSQRMGGRTAQRQRPGPGHIDRRRLPGVPGVLLPG
jgi:hypothetical protein